MRFTTMLFVLSVGFGHEAYSQDCGNALECSLDSVIAHAEIAGGAETGYETSMKTGKYNVTAEFKKIEKDARTSLNKNKDELLALYPNSMDKKCMVILEGLIEIAHEKGSANVAKKMSLEDKNYKASADFALAAKELDGSLKKYKSAYQSYCKVKEESDVDDSDRTSAKDKSDSSNESNSKSSVSKQ